ncbi:hypothetical protein [Chromobacterium violaceum]|uniref:hypothetical protein n=1 Tax=Chromobacterium violaceum TaxID=536 RepID=UPI0015FE4DAF|nr:hypothetical protein [Chromobacterium violaceum]MBA8735341.1 hypothetical protein [Chromobacterium violaceum]
MKIPDFLHVDLKDFAYTMTIIAMPMILITLERMLLFPLLTLANLQNILIFELFVFMVMLMVVLRTISGSQSKIRIFAAGFSLIILGVTAGTLIAEQLNFLRAVFHADESELSLMGNMLQNLYLCTSAAVGGGLVTYYTQLPEPKQN